MQGVAGPRGFAAARAGRFGQLQHALGGARLRGLRARKLAEVIAQHGVDDVPCSSARKRALFRISSGIAIVRFAMRSSP